MTVLLDIDGLSVDHGNPSVRLLHRVDLTIAAGQTVCLVGESGSGKSVTALSVMRLIDFRGGTISEGAIRLDGLDLASLSQREMNNLRGRRIGIVFQEPMTAFDPVFSVGQQIMEVVRRHLGLDAGAARVAAIELLRRVHIPDPELRVDQYPHQLSGGMRQRAMIAMALACEPDLLIADEPTTALDVTIQAQILGLLRELQVLNGMAILLITHDLGVAAEMADRVAVMYSGRVVENATAESLFARPAHPYTRGLLRSVIGVSTSPGENLPTIAGSIPDTREPPKGCRFHPRCELATGKCRDVAPPLQVREGGHVACWHAYRETPATASPVAVSSAAMPTKSEHQRLLTVSGLHKRYDIVRALDGISFHIDEGETFGLVGESGCGKSTLARLLMRLETPTSGQIQFSGQELRRVERRHLQMVFQDPYGSIDPRWNLRRIIGEPLAVHLSLRGAALSRRVGELLEQVGLDPLWQDRYPHALSGGQRQRVAIARAVALNPRFIIADEAVSALDVSVQAQIINLLIDLKQRLGLTYLFIGHGLHLVRHISDRIGVMYLGKLVEIAPADELFRDPAHPYTQALLAAIPAPDPTRRGRLAPPKGEVPSPANPPDGCRFHTRCDFATAMCRTDEPVLMEQGRGHFVACHFPLGRGK